MKIFLTVARLGNINKAAEELYLSHQNLSFIIRNMESELGDKLFIRSKKGVELTEKGAAFLQIAQPIVAMYDNFLNVKMDNKILKFHIYTTPGVSNLLSDLMNFDLSENHFYSFYKQNVNELLYRLSHNEQGIYIIPIHSQDSWNAIDEKQRLILRKDKVVIIAHKNSKYMNCNPIDINQIPLLTCSYNVEEKKERFNRNFLNVDNLNICKKMMQSKDFCYADTRWVYENFFANEGDYVILEEEEQDIIYTLVLNLPENMKEIALHTIVPELQAIFK